MRSLRRLLASIGAVAVIAVGACLVFDGKVAIVSSDAGPGDASVVRSVDSHTDGTGSDAGTDSTAPTTDAGNGPGVTCGNSLCAGGTFEKCCAKPYGDGGWKIASPACSMDCSRVMPGGFDGYQCDSDDSCTAGQVCCALRALGTGPGPYTSSMCTTGCPPDSGSLGLELCQLDAPHCTTGTCVEGDRAYLPPSFNVCK
jgi:hypothetical protein